MAPGAEERGLMPRFFSKNAFSVVEIFAYILERILYFSTIQCEVFLRTNFGVRYFPLHTFMVLAIYLVIAANIDLQLIASDKIPWEKLGKPESQSVLTEPGAKSAAFPIFVYTFIFLGLLHKIASFQKAYYGRLTYTRSSGDPHRIWEALPFASTANIKRFFEPILVVIIGYCVFHFLDTKILGAYLLVCSVCLFVKNNLEHERLRNYVLDQLDATTENDYIEKAVVDLERPRNTNGFYLPGPFPADPMVRQAMANDFLGHRRDRVGDAEKSVDEMADALKAAQASGNGHSEDDKVFMIDEPEQVPAGVQEVMDEPEIKTIMNRFDPGIAVEVPDEPQPKPEPTHQSKNPKAIIKVRCHVCKKVTTGTVPKNIGTEVPCVVCKTPIFVYPPDQGQQP